MKNLILSFAFVGAALAATPGLPDYPYVYSPEAGGPVPNPAYQRQVSAEAADTAGAPHDLLRYTVDLNIGYGFKATSGSKYACDVFDFELEGAYFLRPHHALTLSAGFASGGRTDNFWVKDDKGYYPFTDSYDRSSFMLMGGYRFSHMLGRYCIVQLGAKCGMDVQTLRVDYGYGWTGHHYNCADGCDDDHHIGPRDTAVGMAYAGYADVGFFVTPTVCLHAGYQFKGTTAKPSPRSAFPDKPSRQAGSMRWHEVRLGITMHF